MVSFPCMWLDRPNQAKDFGVGRAVVILTEDHPARLGECEHKDLGGRARS